MKKGFTLIEIIISISLILIISVSSSAFVINKQNNKEIEEITNKIVDATNVYINVETDNNGNTYKNGIYLGGVGVEIGVKSLLTKGYIDKMLYNQLLEKTKNEGSELKLLVSVPTKDYSDCDEGVIQYTVSWDVNINEPIYLCNYGNDNNLESKTLIDTILSYYDNVEILDTIKEENYNIIKNPVDISENNPTLYHYIYSSKENGLYKRSDETYYYRGNVDDNYIKIKKGVNNYELFRIISFKGNKVRLIREETLENNDDINNLDEYKKSELKNIVDGYYSNLQSFYQSPLVNSTYNNLFQENDIFCLDEKEVVSEENFNMSQNCAKKEEMGAGLLSLEEAIYAGVPLKPMVNTGVNGQTSSRRIVISNNWLSSGDTTVLLNRYKYNLGNYDGTYNLILTNDLYKQSNNYMYGAIEFYESNSSWKDKYKKRISKSIRPVIILNNEYTKIKGDGTLKNPYELI